MIIDSVVIYKYSLKLNRPLYVRGKKLSSREGFILKLTANGKEGFGDIAPLEGVSTETLDDCLNQLKKIRSGFSGQAIPSGIESLKGGFEKWIGFHRFASSVRFGLELAILNLLANKKDLPLGNLLNDVIYEQIQVNGFLEGNKDEVLQQAGLLLEQGFHALKLKVGEDIDEEIKKVQALNRLIEGKAVLHVDANRSWDINKAVHFAHEIGLSTVDYIEEPFKDLKDVPDFFMKTTIPFAADESLKTIPLNQLKSIEGIEVVILKPTILGGIEQTYQLIHQAHSFGLSTVISSCFESSIGILALANLAGASSRHQGAGLDTLKYFANDTLKEPVKIERGKINITQRTVDGHNINFDILDEIKP